MLPILPYRYRYSLNGGANVWLGPFKIFSNRVTFRILRDRVLFKVLSDRVLFRALSDKVLFRVLSNRVLLRVLSDRILFRVLLRVLTDNVLLSVLIPRFVVCHVPSIESTTWGICFKHFNSNRCFDYFLRKFSAITGNFIKFLKREKRLHLKCFNWVLNTLMQNLFYSEVFIKRYSKR